MLFEKLVTEESWISNVEVRKKPSGERSMEVKTTKHQHVGNGQLPNDSTDGLGVNLC
jgi:hypothetical protein